MFTHIFYLRPLCSRKMKALSQFRRIAYIDKDVSSAYSLFPQLCKQGDLGFLFFIYATDVFVFANNFSRPSVSSPIHYLNIIYILFCLLQILCRRCILFNIFSSMLTYNGGMLRQNETCY